MSEKKPSLLQAVDEKALTQYRRLTAEARYGALAVLEPATGHPMASRVALAFDLAGQPILLMSALASHATALAGDPRCSLLIGEPGTGDPLAYPRVTLIGQAERVQRDGPDHMQLRARYLLAHPKAELYVDFGDFAFYRLCLQRAAMNAGFGKAYLFDAQQLAAAAATGDGSVSP